MRRKILSTLLAVCVLAGTAAVPGMSMHVRAEEYAVETVGVTGGDYEYEDLVDGTAEITGYHGNDTEIVIPAEIDGRTVSSIGDFAFYDCSSLISITIPDRVTSIRSSAFSCCRSLSSITIPDSVTSIGEEAFWGCRSLSSITIPDSVTSIRSNAFNGCSSLSSISIPGSVTTIEWGTFSECSRLSSIMIPESVTRIGGFAFDNCSRLSSITIPNSVTSIGQGAFFGCSSLRDITIPEGVTTIEDDTFWACSNLSSITIPEGVTSIGDSAFLNCSSLSSITIPDSVTSIGSFAFDQCNNFDHVYFNGTREQWKAVSVNYNDNLIFYSVVIHCIDGDLILTKPETSTATRLNADNVQLSAAKVTYNGKAQMPTVAVKDNQGKTVADSNYTVQYTNNQNVGQARVTVTFKGSYSGTVTKTFDIVPKGTQISKATAKKKGFTVKWKKQTEQTTGYEIQYSTSSKFNGAKTAGNIKAKKTSKTISKLKAKKKYYIRIRTYKTVGGRNYYSDWSAKKSVKTKRS